MSNAVIGISSLLVIFFVKILENMLDATKILMLQKGKHVFSGVLLIMVLLINYSIMKKMVSATGPQVMIAAALGAGIGYTLAGFLGERFFNCNHIEFIMSDDTKAIIKIHEFLTENHIKHKVEKTLTKDLTEETLTITALPNTQMKHKMIFEFLDANSEKLGHVILQTF